MGPDSSSGARVAVRVRVRGDVQGVAYRWYAQRRARELGVVGWVRNQSDGSVAAHLEGPPDAVEAMAAWCAEGSPAARVRDVTRHDAEPEGASTFESHS